MSRGRWLDLEAAAASDVALPQNCIGEWHPLRAVKLLSLVSYKLDYQAANSYARRCLHLLAYRQRAVARWHWYC